MAGIRGGTATGGVSDLAAPPQHVGLVEQEGIVRAKQRALDSDVVILMCSVEPGPHASGHALHLEADVMATASKSSASGSKLIVVINKVDRLRGPRSEWLPSLVQQLVQAMPSLSKEAIFAISCKTAVDSPLDPPDSGGIQGFLHGLTQKFQDLTSPLMPAATGAEHAHASSWEESIGASERQRLLLDECSQHLETFRALADATPDERESEIVVAAESLRAAAECLGRMTGKGESGDVEEVLGVVFEKYARPHGALRCLLTPLRLQVLRGEIEVSLRGNFPPLHRVMAGDENLRAGPVVLGIHSPCLELLHP